MSFFKTRKSIAGSVNSFKARPFERSARRSLGGLRWSWQGNWRWLFLSLGFVFWTGSAFAASFYIDSVVVSDNDPQVVQSVRALMETSVSNAEGAVAHDPAHADFVLRANVIKLGPALVLTVSRWKDGRQQFAAKQKANGIQELDDATDRAVRAAMIGVPTKKDTRVGEVSEREQRQMRTRVESKNSAYFGFGPAGFRDMGVNLLAYDLALGYLWGVAPQWDVKVLLDVVTAEDWKTNVSTGTLGLNYYFTDANVAPYVTAGLGFGVSATSAGGSNATSVGGFAGDIGVGLSLFRISSTQFDLALTYNSLFANNTIGAPGFYSFRIGVVW